MRDIREIMWCIHYLKCYNKVYNVPLERPEAQLRALMNITMPVDLSEEFYARQDGVLSAYLAQKEITDVSQFEDGISVNVGDITLIRADAIVNACNNKMLGCFVPGHVCIDNAIHSFAGLQVRRDMMAIMAAQGHDEPNGMCKVTPGYNLPSRYIFHTVGPIYSGSRQDEIDLANCYLSCLKKADEMGLTSIVFCCIATGLYGFPGKKAADIAVRTVRQYIADSNRHLKKVVFDVFSEEDYDIYDRLLICGY